MSKRHLVRHYHLLQERFRQDFEEVVATQSIGSIHRLRVGIKQLRAFWSFLEMASQGQFNAWPYRQLYRPLFKKAGQVREAQITLRLIKKKKAAYLRAFANHLHAVQAEGQQALGQALSNFDLPQADQLDQSLLVQVGRLSEEKVLHDAAVFVLRHIREVAVLQQQLPDEHKLHRIRIRLKAVDAMSGIMREIRSSHGLDKWQQAIRALNIDIGQWHDQIVLLRALQHYIPLTANQHERKRMQSWSFQLAFHQMETQAHIHHRLMKFFRHPNMSVLEHML
ncbi:MAG: CHAD domain-containing protein [Lewinella sp.]|nr:CHAD domain-containing protein [Lewinella sp.]